ncbi:LLM class flavin-dependent oxidoreductase [Pseudomonas qingdaonensis]|nr:LLM class flavin-dependent oxidoreductase [Pseudomonas qingdaonensis]
MNTMTHPTAPAVTCGANAEAFAHHPGYRRMFAADHLTLGIFLPLRFYQGDMAVLHAQAQHVSEIERLGFAAVWVRDVPLFDPAFGDAGQVFDPSCTWATWPPIPGTSRWSPAAPSSPLRHPIDLAKSAASLDRLSGGRLVMGIASGTGPWSSPPTAWPMTSAVSALPTAWTTFGNCWRRALRPSARRWAR